MHPNWAFPDSSYRSSAHSSRVIKNKPFRGPSLMRSRYVPVVSMTQDGSSPESKSLDAGLFTTRDNWPQIQLNGVVLRFASNWDLIGVVESYVLNVYGCDRLQPGSNVLDVGAGIGDFSILASRKVGPRGRVIAIEPNPEDYAVLIRNLEVNGCGNVTPLNLALARSQGIEMLEFKGRKFRARTTTLANALKEAGVDEVDFIKMDIEGFEAMVVPSSLDVLGRARFIAIELHGDQEMAVQALSKEGFSFSPVDTPLLTSRLVLFAIAHPIVILRIYSRVRHYPPYSPSGLLRRAFKGPSIAQRGKLLVGVFGRIS